MTTARGVAIFRSVNVAPYRDSAQSRIDPWAALMRRRRWGLGGLVLMLVGVGLIAYDLGFAGVAPVVIGVVLLTYAEWAKCPHCGKKFARRGLFHNSFTRHCLNCGVKIGTLKAST